MTKRIARAALVSLALFACGIVFPAARAAAEIIPLRSGTVVSKSDAGVQTFIKAVDAAGKEFWILTSICTIGEKGKIDVLAGAHYDKLKSDVLGTVIEDVYVAQLLRIGEMQVTGFGAHGLPDGCVMLK